MMNLTPIILNGSSGNRLWPLSRSGLPKQFLCLTGKESFFQQGALLSQPWHCRDPNSIPLIVTGEDDIVRSKDTFGHVSK
jgi:mannose-1-phosphate guanylyltransferase/mannose-6-phosphate isomerase